jgi:hypothetical protein
MDFTIKRYSKLLDALSLRTDVFLRHDVDVSTSNALRLARLESDKGVKSTYYFRARHFTSSNHVPRIKTIASLGHTIGYHYENLTTTKGNVEEAYHDFERNLALLRQIAQVSTACAHGSPASPWDSQEIFESKNRRIEESKRHYDIHALGIEYEPMIDTDFSTTLYLTDTGRRWDGYRVSIRDKVPLLQEKWEREGLSFHTTDDLIAALHNPSHPIHRYKLLINTHPERWATLGAVWVKEFCLQWLKNIIKGAVVAHRNKQRQ